MFPSRALLSSILVCLAVAVLADANPSSHGTTKATLSIARRADKGSMLSILSEDRARVYALQNMNAAHMGKRSTPISVANAMTDFTAQVGVGSPPTNYTLLIDTGSSNTWIGASKPYIETNTSEDTGNTVLVRYGTGNFSGEEWKDTVTLAPDLVISNQSIGVANRSFDFPYVDGILGVGPVDLTNGTVTNEGTLPTVMDNLLSQGTISEEVLGIYFVPYSEPNSNGSLTFGGIDETVITSEVNYVPLTTISPASHFWGVNQSVTYGDATILSSTAGIVDTGTTLIYLTTDAFHIYQNATGGVMDNSTGLLKITPDQYNNLQPLTFQIGDKSYDLCPNGQIWPRSLNTAINGTSDSIYLVVGNMGSTPLPLKFIIGYTFLERFYSVYDTTNRRVGFASTNYTDSTAN